MKETSAKSRSCVVRSLIKKDVDVNKSTTLNTYEAGSEEEGTSSRSPKNTEKTEVRKKGVEKKLKRLKEELLVKLKSQVGAQA